MKRIRTSLLIALLLSAGIVAAIACAKLSWAKARAEFSARDLAICTRYLAEIRAAQGASPANANTNRASGGVSTLIRNAASATATTGQLAGIEPGQPARIAGTDYEETPVFLRLSPMPMKQLVTFLHETSARDPRARCRTIELSAAEGRDDWSADVTLGYLTYVPQPDTPRSSAP
jgi:hypothetical protein